MIEGLDDVTGLNKPPGLQERVTLNKEDWDFSRVPEGQRENCFIYECLREWPLFIINLIALGLKNDKSSFPDKTFPRIADTEVDEFSNIMGFRNAAIWTAAVGQFLVDDVPWQGINDVAKQQLEVAFGQRSSLRPHFLTKQDIQEGVFLARERPKSHFVVGINWDASDAELMRDFDRFIKAARKKPALERRGVNPSNWLKMIGAMRLMHHYPFGHAYSLSREHLGQPLYGQRPSWERARKGALEAFRTHFFIDWTAFSAPPVPRSYFKYRAVLNP